MIRTPFGCLEYAGMVQLFLRNLGMLRNCSDRMFVRWNLIGAKIFRNNQLTDILDSFGDFRAQVRFYPVLLEPILGFRSEISEEIP